MIVLALLGRIKGCECVKEHSKLSFFRGLEYQRMEKFVVWEQLLIQDLIILKNKGKKESKLREKILKFLAILY